MKDDDKMERLIVHLKRHYYGNIVSLVLFFLLILFRAIPLFRESDLIGVSFERYAIMISIIAIPVALKFFADRLKKILRPIEKDIAVRKYKNASYLRLYTLSAVTLLNIVLFGFSRNTNFMWITVILLLIFLYCKPSYTELVSLTEVPEVKTKAEEENMEEPENRTDNEEASGK